LIEAFSRKKKACRSGYTPLDNSFELGQINLAEALPATPLSVVLRPLLGGTTPNTKVSTPRWRELYESALLETDHQKLKDLVNGIEEALLIRAMEIGNNWNHADERDAMAKVAEDLLLIKTEKLKWPPIEKK
jgi:hypothetical protein